MYIGDIFAVFGADCASGDTFVVDNKLQLSMESMYVPDPVVAMAISPVNSKDRDNFSKAVARFTKEDPTFHFYFDDDNKETIVAGKYPNTNVKFSDFQEINPLHVQKLRLSIVADLNRVE